MTDVLNQVLNYQDGDEMHDLFPGRDEAERDAILRGSRPKARLK